MIRHLVMMVTLGMCIVGCAGNRSEETDDLWTYEPVPVTFKTNGWRLFIGARGEIGEPIEAFLHLYAKRDGKLVMINEPTDMNKLKGLSVRSCEAALSYVRLFTQPETFMLFSFPNAIEKDHDAAEVITQDGAFLVVRQLVLSVKVEDKGNPLIRVKERVTFTGNYTLVSMDIIAYVPSEDIAFPILE